MAKVVSCTLGLLETDSIIKSATSAGEGSFVVIEGNPSVSHASTQESHAQQEMTVHLEGRKRDTSML